MALQGEQAFGEAGVLGGVGDAQGVEGAGLGLATGDGLGGVPELCGEGLDGRGGVVGGGRAEGVGVGEVKYPRSSAPAKPQANA